MPKIVLCTTAILVHFPDDEEDTGFDCVDPFDDRLLQAIQREFQGSPTVEYPGVIDREWVDLPGVNLGKCAACGRWVTDYTQPDDLKGISAGRTVDGRLLCDECEFFGDSAPAEEAVGDG